MRHLQRSQRGDACQPGRQRDNILSLSHLLFEPMPASPLPPAIFCLGSQESPRGRFLRDGTWRWAPHTQPSRPGGSASSVRGLLGVPWGRKMDMWGRVPLGLGRSGAAASQKPTLLITLASTKVCAHLADFGGGCRDGSGSSTGTAPF